MLCTGLYGCRMQFFWQVIMIALKAALGHPQGAHECMEFVQVGVADHVTPASPAPKPQRIIDQNCHKISPGMRGLSDERRVPDAWFVRARESCAVAAARQRQLPPWR